MSGGFDARIAAFFTSHAREILDDWRGEAQLLAQVTALAGKEAAGAGLPEIRFDEPFDLGEVVAELCRLRQVVLRIWIRESSARLDDTLLAIDRSIDQVIAACVAGSQQRAASVAAQRERILGKLESLLAVAPIPIAFVDRDLRFLRVNEALARIDGVSVKDHLGLRLDEVLPNAGPQLIPVLQGILDSGQPVLNWEIKRASPSAPHDVRSFVAYCFPVRGESGPVLGLGAILIEVTERERAEERLREAIRLRDEVLAIVSHDLRNPLATIKLGAAQVVELEPAHTKTRKCVDMIERSVGRMEHLIEDLLDTAAIRAGKLTIRPRPVDALAVIREAVELHEPAAAETGVALQCPASAGPLMVLCDRNRVLQLFGNLIGNAIKFCGAGDTVTVTGEQIGEHAEFCVTDTGPGIEPHLLPTIFEPFRGTPQQLRRTSGLGLYICKGIVEAHGGRIWVETKLGHGTQFFFTLPVGMSCGGGRT